MFDPAAYLIEQRAGTCNIRHLAANQAKQLALPCGSGGATDRTFDEGCATAADFFRERDFVVRLHGTHFDDELA